MEKDKEMLVKNKKSLKRFLESFKYCYEGLRYAFYHEQNIIIMLIMGIIALILGLVLNITDVERLVVILLIIVIMSLEMVNTAIEEVVDLIGKHNEKAKVAKDCASGAVGLASILGLIIGIMIYLPRIIEFIRGIL